MFGFLEFFQLLMIALGILVCALLCLDKRRTDLADRDRRRRSHTATRSNPSSSSGNEGYTPLLR